MNKKILGPKGNFFIGNVPAMQRDTLSFYSNAQKEFGDYVRFRAIPSIYWYSITHPDAIHHILVGNRENYGKGKYWINQVSRLGGNGMVTSEGDFWKKQRNIVLPAFHQKSIRTFTETMTNEIQSMLSAWDKKYHNDEIIDVAAEMMQVGVRIAAQTLMNVDLSQDAVGLRGAIEDTFSYVSECILTPWQVPPPIPTKRNRNFFKQKKIIDDMVYGIIADRRKSQPEKIDILTMLMHTEDEDTGEKMSDLHLRNEIVTLLIAGHETVASALGWAWYLLAQHPDVEAKLKEEVDNVLNGKIPTYEDIAKLKYTRMVLDEVLRLYPSAWAIPRTPKEDDEINGFPIKKGCPIAVVQWVTHRHPDFWDDPEKFDPERFAEGKGKDRHKYAYFPFGGGERFCIGKQFAIMEGVLVLAMVMQRYRLKLIEGQTIQPEVSFTLTAKYGIKCKLEKNNK